MILEPQLCLKHALVLVLHRFLTENQTVIYNDL